VTPFPSITGRIDGNLIEHDVASRRHRERPQDVAPDHQVISSARKKGHGERAVLTTLDRRPSRPLARVEDGQVDAWRRRFGLNQPPFHPPRG
jgi:hypothetical protein